ncbi:SGNH/GDSL hydrolase family protein [Streptomyces ureilyticus]|uniref:SGNH/GDSL hydrolase family protein n=1 Tax=Streptomyces ureilyticus TaxID=1775131 RepID=A0ABX0DYN2_9ACTN|nr:SGNH/GDSL hydrolase family protein [Streptomyces ureilyticus]NGO44132.1 SGNH/GDSL hydrolase family protein [Streptomyces ureilyticus]
MRRRGHRSRAVAVTAAAALLGIVGTAGCDAVGGNEAAPTGSTSRSKPSTEATTWNLSPNSIAAVGDSITRAFDACEALSDCPKVSWATGSDAKVDSLALRLLGKSGAAQRSWNYAKTGAQMAELDDQLAQAATKKPELVTMLAGANDACQPTVAAMTSVPEFRAQFEDAMNTLRETSPKTQVFVASVPDLKRLWSIGRTNEESKEMWQLGICSSMLAEPDDLGAAASSRRDKVQDRVKEYNAVLEDVCEKDKLCRFDGGAVYKYRFDAAQLSTVDWFHPSTSGQKLLAEMAYRVVTAPKPDDLKLPTGSG